MTIFTFLICSEPYKFEALDTLLNLGEAILNKGHSIRGIYLFGSGVYNIKGDIHISSDMRNLPERLQTFCNKNDIPLGGCSTWISFAGIKPDEFVKGACQIGLGELSEWAEESDNLIVFGTGGS